LPFPLEPRVGVLPHFIGLLSAEKPSSPMHAMRRMEPWADAPPAEAARTPEKRHAGHAVNAAAEHREETARTLHGGAPALHLDEKLAAVTAICFSRYRTPPGKALYLQLFHEFANVGMCVNGRKYLGNTPTVLGGPTTKMKFGVVGMGTMAHTFHIHGHRWLV